jgi:CubicO group peptidase (beta-lactamase class C family)
VPSRWDQRRDGPRRQITARHPSPGWNSAEQRRVYAELILRQPPAATPGSRYLYSNAGYTLAGHAAETATGQDWETLIRERVLTPLGIKSGGFGSMGRAGEVADLWQHRWAGRSAQPVTPGPLADNPPAIGPAGRLHMSLGDWARFARGHLNGESGRSPLLKAETWKRLHTDPFGGDYAHGWITTTREWAGGRVWTHAGSNTMNFAVAWLAPKRSFGVLVATNLGGGPAEGACDEAAGACIRHLLKE